MKHVFLGPRASGIVGEHASVFSADVHLTNFQNEKTPMPAVSSPFLIYEVQTLFFRLVKSTFRNKNVGGKRQDKAGKDKNY